MICRSIGWAEEHAISAACLGYQRAHHPGLTTARGLTANASLHRDRGTASFHLFDITRCSRSSYRLETSKGSGRWAAGRQSPRCSRKLPQKPPSPALLLRPLPHLAADKYVPAGRPAPVEMARSACVQRRGRERGLACHGGAATISPTLPGAQARTSRNAAMPVNAAIKKGLVPSLGLGSRSGSTNHLCSAVPHTPRRPWRISTRAIVTLTAL